MRRRWFFFNGVLLYGFRRPNLGRQTKLVLSGDIDLQVSGDIKTEIERLADISRLEIDASEVTYIDSSGVAVLILARQHCTRNNMTLALPSISEAVHRVLQIAKLDVMLPIGEVVSAPEPEEFSFGDGDDALGGGDFGDDDDFVNSLLTEVDGRVTMPRLAAGDTAGDFGQADRCRMTQRKAVTAAISMVSTSMPSISPNPLRKRRLTTARRKRSRFRTAMR